MISGARAPISVYEVGTGDPVLVLHGFPDHALGMASIAAAIAAAGGRAIVPALPGYLPSPMPSDGDVSVARVAEDLLSMLDALGVDEAAVVGHDWGALLAYDLGAHHERRITRVVGIGAPHPVGFRVRRRIVREQQTAAYAWLLAFATSGPELAADPVWLTQLQQLWSPGLRRDDWDEVLALLAQPEVAAAVCRWYRCDLDGDDVLGDVLVPATVIHGAQDGCIGPAVYLDTDDRFAKGVRRITLPEAGHWPHLETPAKVLPMIVDGLGLGL
jgi:pimeloyl-ACP methyl ester carboxylesterase